jgi:hypothetical protein
MSDPLIRAEGMGKCKAPALAWQKNAYRIVVVYNTAGSAPAVVLEKLVGKDSLGEPCWQKQELPKEFPQVILADLAELASGDKNILKNL